ncbi:MAG: hypothetical protein ILP11_03025 [Alphaproteobacteria bacterium]|nr:hypothetical protein [Alphaproteobacteria bacterium]
MKTVSFTYIHNNYTTPLLEGIRLPAGLNATQITDFNAFPYTDYQTNIVLFRLSGEKPLRRKENALIKHALTADHSFVYLIIMPFSFEKDVNRPWAYKQLSKLQDKHKNFELIDMEAYLKEMPNATFDEAFQQARQVIELICSVYANTFRG